MATEDQIVKKLTELKLADTPANRQIAINALEGVSPQGAATTTTVPAATLPPIDTLEAQILAQAQGQTTANKSGANYLLGYAYPQRIIKGNVSQIPNSEIVKDIETFRGGGGTVQKYTGSFLVDLNGNIARKQYDLSPMGESNTILLELLAKNPVRYKTFTNLLQTRGYYGSAKPSTNRVDQVDRYAFSEFLNNVANANGVTWDVASQILETTPQSLGAGTKAPSIRVTSEDDLKVVFRKASTDLLGYEVDDATAKKFAKTYRQMEIAEGQKQAAGGVFESAAAPSTVAEQQILKQFQPEAKSFAAANYAQIMDARIKELGA
jgi:hypothetical protein